MALVVSYPLTQFVGVDVGVAVGFLVVVVGLPRSQLSGPRHVPSPGPQIPLPLPVSSQSALDGSTSFNNLYSCWICKQTCLQCTKHHPFVRNALVNLKLFAVQSTAEVANSHTSPYTNYGPVPTTSSQSICCLDVYSWVDRVGRKLGISLSLTFGWQIFDNEPIQVSDKGL